MKNENRQIAGWLIGTIVVCLVMAAIGFYLNDKNTTKIEAKGISAPTASARPNSTTQSENHEKTVVSSGLSEESISPIEADIKSVFGKYYPQAMILLKGKPGDSCAENKSLNPNAVNDNTLWGGVGQDIGVFQINTKWQGVTNTAFLKDPAINIRMAWRIFVNQGYKFGVQPTAGWTCGRYYGI